MRIFFPVFLQCVVSCSMTRRMAAHNMLYRKAQYVRGSHLQYRIISINQYKKYNYWINVVRRITMFSDNKLVTILIEVNCIALLVR